MNGKRWTDYENQTLARMLDAGTPLVDIAKALGRSPVAVDLQRGRLGLMSPFVRAASGQSPVARPITPPPPPPPPSQSVEVETTTDGDQTIAAKGPRLKTVDDVLAHVGVDRTRFEIASQKVGSYESTMRGEDGEPVVTQMYTIRVTLKRKQGPSIEELVGAMIAGAVAPRKSPPALRLTRRAPLWQVLVVADPHFGKYAWGKATRGGDYDLTIASEMVRGAADHLLAYGDERKPTRRTIALLGDQFHYDTVGGTTTGGTVLDRDSRIQRMIEMGSDALLGVIERSAQTCPTDVILVPGNHDGALSWALQRILVERFRGDTRVTVNTEVTSRKYLSWGQNLLGFTHGDKAKKRLPQLMALEQAAAWGASRYREIHTGHLHQQAAERQHLLATIDGVIVRTAPALCPPDSYHADEGYVGATQAMETFLYHEDGGLAGMEVARVDALERQDAA